MRDLLYISEVESAAIIVCRLADDQSCGYDTAPPMVPRIMVEISSQDVVAGFLTAYLKHLLVSKGTASLTYALTLSRYSHNLPEFLKLD